MKHLKSWDLETAFCEDYVDHLTKKSALYDVWFHQQEAAFAEDGAGDAITFVLMWSLVEEEIYHWLLVIDVKTVPLQVMTEDCPDAFWCFQLSLLWVLGTGEKFELLVRIVFQNFNSYRYIAQHLLN